MSTRSQVFIKETGVYLYQHCDGYDLPNRVQRALAKRWRWNDIEYLTRIIFCEMMEGRVYEETGFGIGTVRQGDIEYLVIIDNGTVEVQSGYDERMETLFKGTFEEFLNYKEEESQ